MIETLEGLRKLAQKWKEAALDQGRFTGEERLMFERLADELLAAVAARAATAAFAGEVVELRAQVAASTERERRIIFELHRSHRRPGDFNFGVRTTIGDLTIEEMNNFRKMLVVAIGTAEDMFRRDQERRYSTAQAAPSPGDEIRARLDS